MRRLTLSIISCIVILGPLFVQKSLATHIIGGEITYQCVDTAAHQYEIDLTLYRDCSGGNAGYDPVAYVGIYEATTDTLLDPPGTINISFPGSDTVYTVTGPNTDICVSVAHYTTTVQLPAANGYHLMYQRCCRSGIVKNLQSPLSTGDSWVTDIPAQSCNSSPAFQMPPPFFACIDSPIQMNFAASEPDGDSLTYELCAPTNSTQIVTGPSNVEDSLPNFDSVQFAAGYSYQNPLGHPTDSFSINQQTGWLTGSTDSTMATDSLYPFAVCVNEYDRSTDSLLSRTKRDYSLALLDCDSATVQKGVMADFNVYDTMPNKQAQDTMYFQDATQGYYNHYTYHFGDGTTSSKKNPPHIYPTDSQFTVQLVTSYLIDRDTATYTVQTRSTSTELDAQPHLIQKVAPNPASNITTFYLSKSLSEVTLTLYNIQSQQVREVTLSEDSEIPVSMQSLPNGVYLYRLQQDGHIIGRGKILKK